MENTKPNKSAASGANKQKHFATSMTILGISLVVVIVIAVVAIISGIGAVSGDGLKLHGHTANELYSGMKAAAENTDNYTVTLTKRGGAQLKDSTLAVNIVTEIVNKVEGDNMYYKEVTTTTYTAPESQGSEKIITELITEITLVDGTVYVHIKSGDEETKSIITSEEYTDSFDVFAVLLWEDRNLFDGAKFETDGSEFKVSTTAGTATIYDDMNSFFANKKSLWILPLFPTCSDVEYTVRYDNDCKPVEVKYGYDIEGPASGNVFMTSDITYGYADVEAPADASDYKTAE